LPCMCEAIERKEGRKKERIKRDQRHLPYQLPVF
jgi:hypothetical protein